MLDYQVPQIKNSGKNVMVVLGIVSKWMTARGSVEVSIGIVIHLTLLRVRTDFLYNNNHQPKVLVVTIESNTRSQSNIVC
jgi:hypothetical protein